MDATTFSLTPAEFAATVAKVEKIQARVAKRGFTGGLAVEGVRNDHTYTDALGFTVTEVRIDTTITGTAPSYDGWTFAARVDVVNDTFTIATAPGVDYISRDLVHVGTCDHCNTARFRKNIFLVRNDETGEIKNVGSTCIKDFLGWSAMPVFISGDDVAREIEPSFGGGERSYSVETILSIAQASIRAYGWVPASSWDGIPTRSDVSLVLSNRTLTKFEKERVAGLTPYIADAAERVAEVREYVTTMDAAGNTFVENLQVAINETSVTGAQIGILAYAPQAYIKSREAAAAKVVAEQIAATSDYIGEVSGKITVTGTISAIRYIDGNYGTTVLYTIVTDQGLVKWFASREALGDKTDVTVTITGTVKGHEEYKGTKSTILTRCKQV